MKTNLLLRKKYNQTGYYEHMRSPNLEVHCLYVDGISSDYIPESLSISACLSLFFHLCACVSPQRMIMEKQEKRTICSDVQESPTAIINKLFKAHHQSSKEISTLKKMLTQRDQEIGILDKNSLKFLWQDFSY